MDEIFGFFVAVAEAVNSVVEEAADSLSDVIETIGNVPRGGAHDGFALWVAGIISGFCNLIGATIRGLFQLIYAVIVGTLLTAIGLVIAMFTGDARLFLFGLQEFFAPLLGFIICVAGSFVALLQKVALLQEVERPLTKEEHAMLEPIFRTSISYHSIRVVEGSGGIFGLGGTALTLCNVIYMNNSSAPQWNETLVHECCHVWQYQHLGVRYASSAVGAQLFSLQRTSAGGWTKRAYDWESYEIDQDGASDWSDFNLEGQAEFISDLWAGGELVTLQPLSIQFGQGAFFLGENLDIPPGTNVVGRFIYDGRLDNTARANLTAPVRDHTALAVSATRQLRNRINLRLSQFF